MHRPWRPNGIVTFASDYGMEDNYVAQVKGAMLSRSRTLTIVDVTHSIPPQDVWEGAFQLATAWSSFPPGTVHLAVVDPGVGTERRAVALLADEHLFVLPDNGLATLVLAEARSLAAWMLDRDDLFRHPVSATFHGRDLFGPVAAALAAGLAPDQVGTPIDPAGLQRLPIPAVERTADSVRGPIVSIDRFGNARTLIRRDQLPGAPHELVVECGPLRLAGIRRTFADVAPGEPVAYIGSHGGLEIAVRDRNAARTWQLHRGMIVEVRQPHR
ncbi:MAG: SAM-dependent chlorinase/fluorinase [Thermomicrobium sp.]|nr:SAM-dependent chlorinase/fluorinase [Thermomicrobium sp.]MDW8060054.1 SAM-dependent chlorinase/fluorinase [Thermomicrobium sp.]